MTMFLLFAFVETPSTVLGVTNGGVENITGGEVLTGRSKVILPQLPNLFQGDRSVVRKVNCNYFSFRPPVWYIIISTCIRGVIRL